MTQSSQSLEPTAAQRRAQLAKDVARLEAIVFKDRDWEKAEEAIRRRPDVAKKAPEAVLTYAFEMADLRVFDELERWGVLQAGPNPKWVRGDALQQAASDLNLGVLDWIWARNARLGYGPKDLTRALCKAAEGSGPEKEGVIDAACWLIDRGAMVNGDPELPFLVLPLSKARYHPGLLEYLISRGARVDWPADTRNHPVTEAARSSAESLKVLDAHGARFDQRYLLRSSLDDRTGGATRYVLGKGCDRTDLQLDLAFAAGMRETPPCRALLEAGADPAQEVPRQGIPMILAAKAGNWDTVRMFAEESPSVRQDKELLSIVAMMAATHRGYGRGNLLEAFKALLSAGAELPERHEGRSLAQVLAQSSEEIKRLARSVRTGRQIEGAMSDVDGDAQAPAPSPGMSPL